MSSTSTPSGSTPSASTVPKARPSPKTYTPGRFSAKAVSYPPSNADENLKRRCTSPTPPHIRHSVRRPSRRRSPPPATGIGNGDATTFQVSNASWDIALRWNALLNFFTAAVVVCLVLSTYIISNAGVAFSGWGRDGGVGNDGTLLNGVHDSVSRMRGTMPQGEMDRNRFQGRTDGPNAEGDAVHDFDARGHISELRDRIEREVMVHLESERLKRVGLDEKKGAIRSSSGKGGNGVGRVTTVEKAETAAHQRWEDDFGDFVHVIQTRFMQEQPDFVELGGARIELFRTFCLPSIIHQTSQNFLWIVRTDPALNATLKHQMIEFLSPHPRFVLVGSNENPEGFRHSGSVKNILNATNFLSGDMNLVRRAHDAAKTRIVLETRLDADDGLHIGFVKQVQKDAAQFMIKKHDKVSRGEDQGSKKPRGENGRVDSEKVEPKWMVWCVQNNLEWHYDSPFPLNKSASDSASKGSLRGYLAGRSLPGCVTPGLTMGYGIGTRRSSLPMGSHTKLHTKIPRCSQKTDEELQVNCLRFLSGKLSPSAIRARTPTSAGMANVIVGGKTEQAYRALGQQAAMQEQLWSLAKATMHVHLDESIRVRAYLRAHLVGIAEENLRGQCTRGHSCKESTKAMLAAIIAKNTKKRI